MFQSGVYLIPVFNNLIVLKNFLNQTILHINVTIILQKKIYEIKTITSILSYQKKLQKRRGQITFPKEIQFQMNLEKKIVLLPKQKILGIFQNMFAYQMAVQKITLGVIFRFTQNSKHICLQFKFEAFSLLSQSVFSLLNFVFNLQLSRLGFCLSYLTCRSIFLLVARIYQNVTKLQQSMVYTHIAG
eukprot:TRINITY_DN6334_c0_g1_i2.p1 TRINITY_DN6334_c0_g1~~TRINITY_DN6334_c0_g1_i2.p1  ORF type:complete len:200 (-),score=-4.15 TRINITY_DN6334_c0_g1_i2:404-964(-)